MSLPRFSWPLGPRRGGKLIARTQEFARPVRGQQHRVKGPRPLAGGAGETLETHLAAVFDLVRPDCVLDVGANVGQFRDLARGAGYEGPIVSFEPCRRPFEELQRRSADDEQWRVQQLALGQCDGRRRMLVAASSLFSSFREPSAYSLRRTPEESTVVAEEEVATRRLDSWWAEEADGAYGERIFLKVDTQGCDLDVVRGAAGILERVTGLQVEGSFRHLYEGVPDCLDTLAFLRQAGFAPTGIFPVIRDSMLRLIEVDCLMVRAD
jgi:FkbM family methyltransferase